MPTIQRLRITKSAVNRLRPGHTLRDTEIKGFGVRSQNGRPSYFLQKKVDGRLKWITIGPHGSPWTPETARRKARSLLLAYANGHSPDDIARERRARRMIGEVVGDFLSEHGPRLKPRTFAEYQRLFDKFIVPKFRHRLLADITHGDVRSFHNGLRKTPSQANFALTALSALYTWAESLQLVPRQSNPCRGVTRFKHKLIERYLTPDQLARLGAALDNLECTSVTDRFAFTAIRLLILTGARRNEILTLTWDDVDLARRRLVLSDSKTGKKSIQLSEHAVGLLKRTPRLKENPYVIPGRRRGTHMTNIHKAWEEVRTLADIGPCRLHDLRHSFASQAALAGASLPMIGKLLGHTQPRTTARYAHLTDASVQQLNDRVGTMIADAMASKTTPGDGNSS